MNATPSEERIALAQTSLGGRYSPNGLSDFLKWFSQKETLEEFLQWRGHPATVRFLGALRAMAHNIPPAYLNRDSVELQYGVTSGLGLAASLIDDPTSVYPDLFTKTQPTPGQAATDGSDEDGGYSVLPDVL